MNVFIRFFHQSSVVFVKSTVLSIVWFLCEANSKNPGTRREQEYGAFSTDLSNTFDCIYYNPLTTRLFWNVVTSNFLNSTFPYSRNWMPGVRIDNSYSRKSKNNCSVLHDSILGPLLFNIDLIDLILECEDQKINSNADDSILVQKICLP